jgi:hypothetical protein
VREKDLALIKSNNTNQSIKIATLALDRLPRSSRWCQKYPEPRFDEPPKLTIAKLSRELAKKFNRLLSG